MAKKTKAKTPARRYDLASLRGFIAQNANADTILEVTGWSPTKLAGLQAELYAEQEQVRTNRRPEDVFVEYCIRTEHNMGDLDDLLIEYRGSKQGSAMVGAIKAKQDLQDRVIKLGQELGLIKREPNRTLHAVVDMSDPELRQWLNEKLHDLRSLADRGRDVHLLSAGSSGIEDRQRDQPTAEAVAGCEVTARASKKWSKPPSNAARREMVQAIEDIERAERDYLRRQVLEFDRIDLLCTEVLGYQVEPHHMRMLRHTLLYPDGNLIEGWRGCGKSTIATVAYAIWLLLKDPNHRILLASESAANAKKFLDEIKGHLEGEAVQSVFGPQVGAKWDENEIKVAQRTSKAKEPSITTVGLDSSVESRHYDTLICDDLVAEAEAKTAYMRKKVHTFYYKVLIPCLEPGGNLAIRGVPHHPSDLYGHLRSADMEGARTLIIPAMTGNDVDGWVAMWPGKFSVEFLLGLRHSMGSIIFATQYLCNAEKMVGGGVFHWDNMHVIPDDQIPDGLPVYGGGDLASALDNAADRFALVVVRFDKVTDRYYVIDYVAGRKRFIQQRTAVIDVVDRHDVAKFLIEAQQYQAVLIQEVKRKRVDLPVFKSFQKRSKEQRAAHLSAKFEQGKIYFRQGLDPLIEELVGFPDGDHDDGFDALDLAIRASRYRKRKVREKEPGVL
jgi:predicted phage terminase large subunit-like protein